MDNKTAIQQIHNNSSDKQLLIDNANTWLLNGVDFEARRIHIDSEVNDIMASVIIRSLLKMSEISDEPIEIYLSSFGGEAYSGLAIYDAITSCPCDVHIIASGKIMSAAFIILLAGDKRIGSNHLTLMMHSVSFESGGKVKDQEIDVQEAKRINNTFLDILQKRSKMKKSWWYRKTLSHDLYMDLETAKNCGIIDSNISSLKVKNVKKTTKSKAKRKKVRSGKTNDAVSNKRVSRRNS